MYVVIGRLWFRTFFEDQQYVQMSHVLSSSLSSSTASTTGAINLTVTSTPYSTQSNYSTSNSSTSTSTGDTVYGPVHLGVANYLLIVVCIFLGTLFLLVITRLAIREFKRKRQIQKTTFKKKLRVRRPGISGASGNSVPGSIAGSVINVRGVSNSAFMLEESASSSDITTTNTLITSPSPDFSVFLSERSWISFTNWWKEHSLKDIIPVSYI